MTYSLVEASLERLGGTRMTDDDIYTLRITAYTPATMPMARLAEYMATLASLLGEKANVHFKGLKTGSTQVISRVEREAAPKVRENVMAATGLDDGEPAVAYRKLNDMLRRDNADAQLKRDNHNVLNFPGRRLPRPPKLGPFKQSVVKDGILVRVGGVDDSAHATILDSTGATWSFEISHDVAQQLAHHLYGPFLRMTGYGRWLRNEEGQWEVSALKATEFSVLDGATLIDVVNRVRNQTGEWRKDVDLTALLRSLRDDDGGNGNGVH